MRDGKPPLNIDHLVAGDDMNIAVERLVYQDGHWIQGWNPYRAVPDFSGELGESLMVLEEARKRIQRHAIDQLYPGQYHKAECHKEIPKPDFELKSYQDNKYYCRIGINCGGVIGDTIPEAICRAAYRSVASYVLEDALEDEE